MVKQNYGDQKLSVPESVERCVHFAAAHELRFYQRLDSLEKTRGVQYLYPGTSEDITGGAPPGTLGARAELQRVVLRDMLNEAVSYGVVLDTMESMAKWNTGAMLLVSISLNAMLDGNPPEGSAEAGTGLLLVSTSTASRHELHPIATIHRPVRSENADLDHAMTCALRWGSSDVQKLGSAWMTGFDGETVGPLHTALSHLNRDTPHTDELREFNLDRATGNAGPSAGWLAVAYAVQTALQTTTSQLVAQRSVDHTVLAVVATSTNDSNNVPHSA